MVGPLDSISSLLHGAVLQSQLHSAQREADISVERRRRVAEQLRRREQGAVTVVEPIEGRIIEADAPLRESITMLPQRQRHHGANPQPDQGRIDVLV